MLGKIELWFPPGTEEQDTDIFIPRDPAAAPTRRELKVRVTLNLRGADEKISAEDVWKDVHVPLSWFPVSSDDASLASSLVNFYHQAQGGTALEKDKALDKTKAVKTESGAYEWNLWWEPQWTVDQAKQLKRTPQVGLRAQLSIYLNKAIGRVYDKGFLVPVDLDIVHPATGELDEGKEDSSSIYVEEGRGGLVALKRDENTPKTKLVLRACPSLPSDSKFRIKTDIRLWTGSLKVWKDQAETEAVVSNNGVQRERQKRHLPRLSVTWKAGPSESIEGVRTGDCVTVFRGAPWPLQLE